MNNRLCYICGPITGLPVEVFTSNFRSAEIAVSIMGYEPVNPVTLNHDHDKTWLNYMRVDISEMVKCEAVYVLPGWGNSKGATIEVSIALMLGLKVIYAPVTDELKNKRYPA